MLLRWRQTCSVNVSCSPACRWFMSWCLSFSGSYLILRSSSSSSCTDDVKPFHVVTCEALPSPFIKGDNRQNVSVQSYFNNSTVKTLIVNFFLSCVALCPVSPAEQNMLSPPQKIKEQFMSVERVQHASDPPIRMSCANCLLTSMLQPITLSFGADVCRT